MDHVIGFGKDQEERGDNMAKKKEYRAGLGPKGGQGMYLMATSKAAATREARKRYRRKYNATAARAKKEVASKNVKVWRNADGSVPAWRKKKR